MSHAACYQHIKGSKLQGSDKGYNKDAFVSDAVMRCLKKCRVEKYESGKSLKPVTLAHSLPRCHFKRSPRRIKRSWQMSVNISFFQQE